MQEYFPNMFAEALVPANPIQWPSFIAGSAMSSDMPEFGDKIKTPFENLIFDWISFNIQGLTDPRIIARRLFSRFNSFITADDQHSNFFP